MIKSYQIFSKSCQIFSNFREDIQPSHIESLTPWYFKHLLGKKMHVSLHKATHRWGGAGKGLWTDASPSWITTLCWGRALCNSVKLWAMPCNSTQDERVIMEIWQNMAYWRRELQTMPVFLPQEPYEQYEKAKLNDTVRWTLQVGRCPRSYWGRAEGK